MTKEQLIEFFGWGLANSQKDFLWITRPNIFGGHEAIMPPEFIQETKGRGMVTSCTSHSMDENMIWLLLKDQTDTAEKKAQQQAVAFQMQFDALCAELQATRGLLQTLYGGDGDFGSSYHRLKVVGFNLEGVAAEWFWWMTRNGLIIDWDKFVESIRNRFWPSKYEDPQRALSKLLQLGTMEDHQCEFQKLMNRVTDILDSLLISFYISGLKLNLQHELLVSRPTTLGDAELASPKIKWSLNTDDDIGVDEVSSAIYGVFDMGESNVESMEVRSKFGEFSENKKSVEEVVGGGEALGVG
ncbi:ty3-gypsy retrotransposon protein [Tanacetum coccineum]